MEHLSRRVFGPFPVEIAIMILYHCDAHSLLNFRSMNRDIKVLAESQRFWKQILYDIKPELVDAFKNYTYLSAYFALSNSVTYQLNLSTEEEGGQEQDFYADGSPILTIATSNLPQIGPFYYFERVRETFKSRINSYLGMVFILPPEQFGEINQSQSVAIESKQSHRIKQVSIGNGFTACLVVPASRREAGVKIVCWYGDDEQSFNDAFSFLRGNRAKSMNVKLNVVDCVSNDIVQIAAGNNCLVILTSTGLIYICRRVQSQADPQRLPFVDFETLQRGDSRYEWEYLNWFSGDLHWTGNGQNIVGASEDAIECDFINDMNVWNDDDYEHLVTKTTRISHIECYGRILVFYNPNAGIDEVDSKYLKGIVIFARIDEHEKAIVIKRLQGIQVCKMQKMGEYDLGNDYWLIRTMSGQLLYWTLGTDESEDWWDSTWRQPLPIEFSMSERFFNKTVSRKERMFVTDFSDDPYAPWVNAVDKRWLVPLNSY